MFSYPRRFNVNCGLLMFIGLGTIACGSDEEGSGTATDSPAVGPAASGEGSSVAGGGRPAVVVPPPGEGQILEEDTPPPGAPESPDAIVCQSESYGSEQAPPDIYIMLDQSRSMDMGLVGTDTTRWQGVTDAIRAFVNDPRAQEVGVGLQYFGQMPIDDCDPLKYAVPDVPIGGLPEVAAAVATSLDNAPGPSTFTPTYPALEGALMHAKEHAMAHPDRATAVLLATDGFPFTKGYGDCNDSIQAIADLAEAAAAWEPPVRTYVIGVSEGLANMESIAEKGGGRAYLIDQGDIKEQFTDAMINIVTTPLGCELDLPTPMGATSLNPALVRVTLTLSGELYEVPKVGSEADCETAGDEGKGWFYDDDADPKAILLCEQACKEFAAGNANIELGCAPKIGIAN